MRQFGLFLGIACCAAGVCSADEALVGDSLRAAVSGKTIHLETPLGAVPISYSPNGTIRGRADGMASYVNGSKEDQGRWWIASNRLCQRWEIWLDAATHCYALSREGDVVRWVRDDGRTGTATIAAR